MQPQGISHLCLTSIHNDAAGNLLHISSPEKQISSHSFPGSAYPGNCMTYLFNWNTVFVCYMHRLTSIKCLQVQPPHLQVAEVYFVLLLLFCHITPHLIRYLLFWQTARFPVIFSILSCSILSLSMCCGRSSSDFFLLVLCIDSYVLIHMNVWYILKTQHLLLLFELPWLYSIFL